MADKRTPLLQNTLLRLAGSNYIIHAVIGYGGSCIAYSAERQPNEYEHSIGMPTTKAVIKEFYPLQLADTITRHGALLEIGDNEAFNAHKSRFEQGTARQVAYYAEVGNHSLPPARLDTSNNTVYSVVDLADGKTLSDNASNLRMHDIARIIGSLCNAVKKMHDADKIYLDLKPSNIFVFNRDKKESPRVALFDFDTVVPLSDIDSAAIPCSDGWSPPEQVNAQRDKISFAADIYSIGAVFYWLISGKKVTPELLNLIVRRKFSFLDDCAALGDAKSARIEAEEVLYATLKREPAERVQTVEELLR
jgi:serine/threonine protein kinase